MKIAYFTTDFSSLSHTFIRREVRCLEAMGHTVDLFGVRPDTGGLLCDKPSDWILRTRYLYPLQFVKTISSFFAVISKHPKQTFKTFFSALFNEEMSPAQHLKLVYHYFISFRHTQTLIDGEYDHIHAHFLNVPASIAMYCSAVSAIPFSITIHSAGIRELPAMIGIQQKLEKASFLRFISHYGLQDFDAQIPQDKPCPVIRCGLELNSYAKKANRQSGPKAEQVILGIGRFVEKKGFEFLLRAAVLLRKRRRDFVLRILGEGVLEDSFRALVSKESAEAYIVFEGPKKPSEVRQFLQSADMVVVPSVVAASGEKEGIPVVIVESMACSVPVIATAHSGIPEVVLDEQTGLLVSESSVEELADAIERFLDDVKLKEKCVEGGLELVQELYDIEKTTKSLLDCFSDYSR